MGSQAKQRRREGKHHDRPSRIPKYPVHSVLEHSPPSKVARSEKPNVLVESRFREPTLDDGSGPTGSQDRDLDQGRPELVVACPCLAAQLAIVKIPQFERHDGTGRSSEHLVRAPGGAFPPSVTRAFRPPSPRLRPDPAEVVSPATSGKREARS